METSMEVIMYSGEHCPTCRILEPVIRELYPDVQVVKLDSDSPEIETLGIRSVPVLIAFTDGVEVGRLIGGVSKMKLKEFLIDNI